MSRERQAYPIGHRSHQGPLLAAIFLVGASIMAAPFLSDRQSGEPAPTATPTSIVPTLEIPTIFEPPTTPPLNPDLSWIKKLADQYFSLDSELSKKMVDRYHRQGYHYAVAICSDLDGSPVKGVVRRPVNVRREPWVGNPPISELKPGAEVSSVFRITESNWLKPFINTWRGIVDKTGNLRFIATAYQGATFVEMTTMNETCQNRQIESLYPIPQK